MVKTFSFPWRATNSIALLAVFLCPQASAIPDAPRAFCETYGDSPLCAGNEVACTLCHTAPPALNAYGGYVFPSTGYVSGVDYDCGTTGPVDDWSISVSDTYCETRTQAFLAALPASIAFADGFDSDNDTYLNSEEIAAGTHPAQSWDYYEPPEHPVDGLENPQYNVDEYDPVFAFKRLWLTYCGTPPTYGALSGFQLQDESSQLATIESDLSICLDSAYWKDEALHRLFDSAIRPQYAVGYSPNNQFQLGDYRYDYRLASHIMTGGRDSRDLLNANYHINPDGDVVMGLVNSPPGASATQGQQLATDKRAGMITTTWFNMINTMFSALPRTTAAQAYREYLGLDIARLEGLLPTEDEPLDLDQKGVRAPACARCHSTLDPLSYAFAYYQGISGANTGTFSVNRPNDVGLNDSVLFNFSESQASIFDTPLTGDKDPAIVGLTGWAEVATESEHFKRKVVQRVFEHATGRPLGPDDHADFFALMDQFDEQNYSVDALIHSLVKTDAFGRP